MTDKEIIINGAIFNKCDGCPLYDGDICTGARLDEETSKKDTNICNEHLAEQFWVVFKQLKRKEQECEELRQEHNRCCEEFKQEINLRIDAYNKLSRDFWSGKYCNAKFCTQLQAKEQECEELKEYLNQAKYLTEGALQLYSERQNIKYKQALNEIEELAKHNNFLVRDPFCGTGYRDLSGQILNIINKAKEQ